MSNNGVKLQNLLKKTPFKDNKINLDVHKKLNIFREAYNFDENNYYESDEEDEEDDSDVDLSDEEIKNKLIKMWPKDKIRVFRDKYFNEAYDKIYNEEL